MISAYFAGVYGVGWEFCGEDRKNGNRAKAARIPRCHRNRVVRVTEQRLWAPWRLDYIKSEKPEGCIFCDLPADGDDRAAYIVHRGDHCFVVLNKFPYNNGHVMVTPYEHSPALDGLDDDTLLELMQLTRRAVEALGAVYGPEGFNIGINVGKIAGAGVEGHVHQHVVPRWDADTNFMPVIGSTRVLPQSLEDSWEALREAFATR